MPPGQTAASWGTPGHEHQSGPRHHPPHVGIIEWTRTMKLGYTIIYVPSVKESLQFYMGAFGLEQKFLHESGDYGELKTGETTLSFASHALGSMNFPGGYVGASASG